LVLIEIVDFFPGLTTGDVDAVEAARQLDHDMKILRRVQEELTSNLQPSTEHVSGVDFCGLEVKVRMDAPYSYLGGKKEMKGQQGLIREIHYSTEGYVEEKFESCQNHGNRMKDAKFASNLSNLFSQINN
jgi:hypothetical protein